MPTLVFSLLGPDRPGLVRELADLVAQVGGNWLESRMVRLGGQFAGVARVRVEDARAEELADALRGVDDQLEVIVRTEGEVATAGGQLWELSLQGQDRPGIVKEVTGILGRLGVNVEEFHSEVASAPMSGEVLFHLDALLRVPEDLGAEALQRELETLSDDLVVDLEGVE